MSNKPKVTKKAKKKLIIAEISKSECKKYKLILFTGRARDNMKMKDVTMRTLILPTRKKNNKQIQIFVDEKRQLAYLKENSYPKFVESVKEYFK